MSAPIVDLALDLPEHWLPVPVERDLHAGRAWAIDLAQQRGRPRRSPARSPRSRRVSRSRSR
ncbi:hypothetical protein [Arenivirga flava]|uniref:Uncharacterized protein n=1 Tax=Arenivirga flava TaxID=1930060 RepID=A0AA37ULN3_9MICO|nr:hypothetical protein [Arenivirga flava]GMA27231.1 hypothetical protein GCM10025874_04840 [Arenivirga flava]